MSRGEIEAVGSENASRTEIANVLGSFKLYTNPEEISVAVHLINSGYWEAWITKWFIDIVKPGYVFVDVGANFGYYTRLVEKLAGPTGKVYAVEANPDLASSLQQSIIDFPIENSAPVTVHNVALSDSVGNVELAIFGNNLGGASILPDGIHGHTITKRIPVKMTTLDTIVDKGEFIDLVKLDIEGAEHLAFKGMENMLDRIDMVVLEVLPQTFKDNARFVHELFYRYNVTLINFGGYEEQVTYEKLVNANDLAMLVIRK